MTDRVAHTKEPWIVIGDGEHDSTSQACASQPGTPEECLPWGPRANIERSVACVNALAGIENVQAIPELIAGCEALMEWQMALAKEDARHKQRPVEFRSFLTPSFELVYDALSKLDGG